jgi:sporulation protein YlmC with PRC-barrel domain
MIRKLMTSTALVALLSAGAVNMAVAADTATTTNTAPAKTEMSAENKLVPENPTLATAFIGRSVYSNQDPESDTIGDVNDLIIGDDGAITDAVIGVGGFLGIGEKNVAVPFNELQVVERDGDIRLIYAATREQLEAAPAVDLAKYEPAARYSEQQAAMNATQDNAAGGAMQPAPADNMAAAPTPGVGMTGDSPLAPADATNADSADQMAADDTSMANHHEAGFLSPDAGQVRASTLIGKAVYSAEHDEVGEISDLVLDKDGGTRVALVDVGGFLGVGEKTVAIPFDELAFAKDGDETQVTIDMNRDQLEQLPAYERPVGATAATDIKDESAGKMVTDTDMAAKDATAADQPGDDVTADSTADDMAANDAKEPNAMTTGALNTDFVAQEVSASDLMGARVHGANDADLGEISDIVFDESGQIDAVVIDVGGFLGIGEKPVAVDFDSLNIRTDQAGTLMVSVNATEDQLNNAPTYDVTMK